MQDDEAAAVLRSRGARTPVEVGLVLGTGLAGIGEAVEDAVSVPYAELPGFPGAGVSGHKGSLTVGTLERVGIAVFQGRAHYYESGNPGAMLAPLRTLKALGAKTLILTNSAGSVNHEWPPGTIALIGDHINYAGTNPLIGTDGDGRFVKLADAYDTGLRERMRTAASTAGTGTLAEGVYMWFSGPSFETPAEVRMARMLGADLVGMSTVPEVILARYLKLRVVALSVVTNFGTGINAGDPSHTETKDVAEAAAIPLERILRAFVKDEAR